MNRDNNFNLVRLLASLTVLVSHGFVLALGNGHDDPLHQWVGVESGRVAVDVFFVVSGWPCI